MNIAIVECPVCNFDTQHIHAMILDNSGERLLGYRVSCGSCEEIWEFMLDS